MIDIRRLGGVLAATVLVAACLAACRGAVFAATPWWPTWLRNDWGSVELPARRAIGAQVAAVGQVVGQGPTLISLPGP